MTIKKTIDFILTLIFPIECLGCNKEDIYLCDECLAKIKIYDQPPVFEHPLTHLNGIIYATDYKQKLLQQIIHNFKFRYIKELAEPLAKILAEFWTNYINSVETRNCASLQNDKPIIIPVPLNKKRLLERGFNQAELIAKIFASQFNYPLFSNAIIRSKNTPHQVGLNKKERLTNVKNSFAITDPELIKDRIVILIDDVVTTGSTLEEIAKTLKQAGAKDAWGLTVAKD
ncbi:MAG: ComF family protein [Candidatus Komeilibacteria bacterium]|nr:ComF family protein [Candidatus Komeilibacteria bacterium]